MCSWKRAQGLQMTVVTQGTYGLDTLFFPFTTSYLVACTSSVALELSWAPGRVSSPLQGLLCSLDAILALACSQCMWHWTNHCIFLGLGFLSCKMSMEALMFLSHFPVLPCQAAVNSFCSENELYEERLGERRKEGNQECWILPLHPSRGGGHKGGQPFQFLRRVTDNDNFIKQS